MSASVGEMKDRRVNISCFDLRTQATLTHPNQGPSYQICSLACSHFALTRPLSHFRRPSSWFPSVYGNTSTLRQRLLLCSTKCCRRRTSARGSSLRSPWYNTLTVHSPIMSRLYSHIPAKHKRADSLPGLGRTHKTYDRCWREHLAKGSSSPARSLQVSETN